ncbi:MAG: DedA family protein [Caldilineaceae bacterium]|nr:DedA family protein [Caldilineaceae bacterium]
MDVLVDLFSFFLHVDEHLNTVVANFGVWTYIILFVVIFCETGLVVTPFLPGDSLLFAAGAVAAALPETLNVWVLITLLIVAAILGDTVNYWIGHWVGPRAFSGNVRFLKQEYLDRTNAFYAKHGGKTIILARFVPIVRTFAPFVAGIGAMNYSRFILYNVVGGIAWVMIFSLLGFYFGSMPFVKENFELVIIAIILISVAPALWEFIGKKKLSVETS